MIKHRPFYLIAITVLLVSCIEINLTDDASEGKPINIALVTRLATDPTEDLGQTAMPTDQISATEPLPTGTPTIEYTLTQSATSTGTAQTDEVATLSPTPTETFESGEISAFVSINAKCRSGPAIVYDVIGYINEGESVFAAGRNMDNSWFLIMKPDLSSLCWAADQVLELDGDPNSLPLATAPPTPASKPSPTPTGTKEPSHNESSSSLSDTPTAAPPYP